MFLLAALSCSLWSAAQFQQVVVEPYTFTNPESLQPDGTITFRVYAEMTSPADFVEGVFAVDGCHPVDISTTTSFFNDEMGFITPAMISQGQYGALPYLEADSWVTIGAENQEAPGAALVQWFPGPDPDAFDNSFGLPLGGSSFILSEGMWFVPVMSPPGMPTGDNNRVLLGQFTTEGELSWTLEGANEVNLTGDVVSLNDYLTFTVGNAACVIGCTEPVACNYDPTANIAVCGACEYTSCQGCTYLGASNFNDQASIDNGSCLFEFENACPADINSDGTVNAGDLLEFLGAFGQTCS